MRRKPASPSRRLVRAAGSAPALLALLALAAPASPDNAPVQVRIERSTFAIGESTTLEVQVSGNVSGTPEFTMPDGLEILGSGRVQNFSWVNGRSTATTQFRYEIAGNQAGHFSVGPFRARLDGQVVVAPAIEVTVVAAEARVSGGSAGPAALVADVEPPNPYVGQPVLLRVRLVQRAQLAEDPQYVPPATPGFWTETASRPESYYAAEKNARVLVTETRTRLYPLATGDQTIGEGAARLALYEPGSDNPATWIGGQVPRREVLVKSTPVRVHVRALPAGAPADFDGAVGVFTTAWSAERAHTSRDVPVTARLEVRGIGNLPLLHAPRLESDDFEIFSAAAEDSLAPPGQAGAGRRTFQWTLLPRREGKLVVPGPQFSWFDPEQGAYRTATLASLDLTVMPAINAEGTSAGAFPQIFLENPVLPMTRETQPWAFALAGGMLGAAFALARASSRPGKDAPERARQRERLRAIGLASGPDFWRAADEASAWLEERGRPVRALRDTISAARYGGSAPDAAKLRRTLIEELSALLPPARAALPMRIAAGALALAGIAFVVLFWGGIQDVGADRSRALAAADGAAREGDVDRSRVTWLGLWREGAHESGIAARLGWAEIRTGSVGPAAAWVLAGEIGEPRDPGLEWVRQRVREAGGLIGSAPGRIPVRRIEWAIAALGLALAAGLAWPARWATVPLALLAIGSTLVFPIQTSILRDADRAVVRNPITLDTSGLELETGQVVRIVDRRGDQARIAAGRGVNAWVPAASLYSIEELK